MTRFVALLSWWDEPADWLADVVRSLALADVDALVAFDGAYPHMPGGTWMSSVDQWHAIRDAAEDVGILWELSTGRSPLWESECAKRTALFRRAEDFDPDWLLVIDADEVILQAPDDLKALLAASPADYADVCSLEQPAQVLGGSVEDADMPQIVASRWVKPRRCLFRAVPGITVGPAHYNYVTPDGRDLWGDEYGHPLKIRDMVIDHRGARRDPERLRARQAYYEARDIAGVERHRVTSWGTAGPEKVAETEALLRKALERA